MSSKRCQPGCVCAKHTKARATVDSSPCLNCGAVRQVFPCYGPGARVEKKYCDRACFDSAQQKRMAERRATGDSRHYDMSQAEYEHMLAAQGGLCAICQRPGNLHRDHCHTSGAWRGLLCGSCNRALGLFGDDPIILLRAADYLLKEVNLLELSDQ